jgi:hypothetical protein
MNVQNRSVILFLALSITISISNAQVAPNKKIDNHVFLYQQLCLLSTSGTALKPYDWSKIINVDIDKVRYPGKFKVVEDIIHNMASDGAGRQILENLKKNNPGKLSIKDKDDAKANNMESAGTMFSADYGIQVIRQDMKYNPIDNELVINFGKSGEMLSFDEQKHQFFKISLNSTIATELESAGAEQLSAVKNCRDALSKLNSEERFLFDNYKDLMGEKFSADDIEHCRKKKITMHNLNTNKDDLYTFSDNVVDALKEYREFAEAFKMNAYSMSAREMPLSQKYTDKLGELHRSHEPVFTMRLGQNRSRSLQFGPITGTDYIALGTGEQNVYKNFSVFYDTDERQKVDNATALTRIKEEFMAQLKYNIEALNSPKMLEYVDRLKKSFNKDYQPNTNYTSVMEIEVAKAMNNNPYLEGANKVIESEIIWVETNKLNRKKK